MQAIDRRPFRLTALTLLAAGMICILAACGPAILPLRQSENGAMPTSQARRNPPLGLSARLVERLANPAMAINGPLHFGDAIALDGDTLAVGAPERSGLIVIDRALSPGVPAGPVATELMGLLYAKGLKVPVQNFVAGLGGRDVTRADFKMMLEKAKKAFAAGGEMTCEMVGVKE